MKSTYDELTQLKLLLDILEKQGVPEKGNRQLSELIASNHLKLRRSNIVNYILDGYYLKTTSKILAGVPYYGLNCTLSEVKNKIEFVIKHYKKII